MSKLSKVIFIIAFCFSSLGLFWGDNPISVEVNKREIKTGEVFSYTIKIEGIFQKPNLNLPDFKNFNVVSQSQSKSYRQKKEGLMQTYVLKYFLFAPEAGQFTIKPAVLEDGDKTYKSKSITIKVKGKPLKEKKKILPYIEQGTDI